MVFSTEDGSSQLSSWPGIRNVHGMSWGELIFWLMTWYWGRWEAGLGWWSILVLAGSFFEVGVGG